MGWRTLYFYGCIKMNRLIEATCRTMLWLSEFELAVAKKYSTNFKYQCACKERVRYWEKEVRLMEVNK